MVRFFLTTLIFCFLISINLIGQTEKYSRIAVKIEARNLNELTALGLPMDGYFILDGYVMELPQTSLDELLQNGYSYKVIIDDVKDYYKKQNLKNELRVKSPYCQTGNYTTPNAFSLGSMGGFHTYAELLSELDSMHSWYPQLITARAAIDTFNTIEGRPVYWVRISNNPNVSQNKPKILYTALTHAREPASMQQMLFYMYFILENYNTHPDITNIVNNFELYFVPCANPDGYVYNETTDPSGGGLWRKNRRDNGNGTFGIDLNRNFGYMWGYDDLGSSPDGSDDTYRGTGPFSEPETRLLKSFCESNNFAIALNYHTYTNQLLFPYGYAENTYTPDSLTYMAYAQILTSENRFTIGTAPDILGYTGNGDSNDWMYAEQISKNKIIAFTPEIGAPAFGFWPPMNEIEAICKSTMKQNIIAAYLAGKYALVSDMTDLFIPSVNSYFKFSIQNLGIDTNAVFTVSLLPLSNNITSTGNSLVFNNIGHLQATSDSIYFSLDPTVVHGDDIVFLLTINNGTFTISDTIIKKAGQKELVFFDDAANLNNWIPGGWSTTTNEYYSAPSSITDSPGGNYSSNSTKQIIINNAVDLSSTNAAYLHFMAKWDMASQWYGNYYDYVQLLISSDNGTTWLPLCGKYSTPSNNSVILGQPAYEGLQEDWVMEEIDLNDYTGHQVLFKFVLKSNMFPWTKTDGFYFDDFTVLAADSMLVTNAVFSPLSNNHFRAYPNPATDILKIEIPDNREGTTLKIYNSTGQKINDLEIRDAVHYEISTNTWSQGVYTVVLQGVSAQYKPVRIIKF
ncbi:MAG: M14 family zinc carboxypeptidase [Bacteroidales bacterium]|nr:M14 family zinc carboxypeptidase [Bacteroidales bacterium]